MAAHLSSVSVAVADASSLAGTDFRLPTRASALRALRALKNGDYAEFANVAETTLACDAQLAAVYARRKALVAPSDWHILPLPSYPDTGEQVDAASALLDSISVRSLDNKNLEGGLQTLVSHALSAVAYGFAAFALDWIPAVSEFRASYSLAATACPHRLFRKKAGSLFLRTARNVLKPLAPSENWAVAVCPSAPLLPASIMLASAKMDAISDWAATLEKFGMPFISAKTSAPFGSQEWTETEDAVRKVGVGFAGVFGEDVELNLHSIAQGAAPHESFVNYADKAISRLWLGGDLNTMAIQNSVGANSQAGAENALARLDAAFIEQFIDNCILRPFVQLQFGSNAALKVYFKFDETKQKKDAAAAASAQNLELAMRLGLPVDEAFAYDALQIPPPREGAKLLSTAPAAVSTGSGSTRQQSFAEAFADRLLQGKGAK